MVESDSLLDTLELVAMINKNQIRKTCVLREHQSCIPLAEINCTPSF